MPETYIRSVEYEYEWDEETRYYSGDVIIEISQHQPDEPGGIEIDFVDDPDEDYVPIEIQDDILDFAVEEFQFHGRYGSEDYCNY